MKYLLLILALGSGAELKAQEIVLYPDSFYRHEFVSKEEFEKSIEKRQIKRPTKWEHSEVRFAVNMDDSSIVFNKGTQEFPQKIEEAWYYKSPFRSRKKIHHYYFVHNPCDVTSIFVDIPSGRNKRTLIYYHQREDLKYEAVYFPYDVNKMNAMIQKMEYGEE
jgi:hypothetical protein